MIKDGVGKTSLLVAAMRAVETKRTADPLFNDPFAENLAGAEGFALLNKAIEISGEQPAIAIRTAFIDQKINSALENGFQQIVMLAAGMDSRAYRMSFPKATIIFELDRTEVLEYKFSKLKNEKPVCERKELAVDLRENWMIPLKNAGFDREAKTLWLVEGLMMYLEEQQVRHLFEKINSLANEGDILLCDILSRTLLESPFMKNQIGFLTSLGAPWKFGTDEPEKFFEKLGWSAKATQPGEFSARWPFPTAPRHIPNIPRSFFVEASFNGRTI